jgi:hypothetical protein
VVALRQAPFERGVEGVRIRGTGVDQVVGGVNSAKIGCEPVQARGGRARDAAPDQAELQRARQVMPPFIAGT